MGLRGLLQGQHYLLHGAYDTRDLIISKNAVSSSLEYASSFLYAFGMPVAPLEKHLE
jgi:hypothetical protein